MHWFGGASYAAAAVLSLTSGRSPMLAFIAVALMVWLVIAVMVEGSATSPFEISDSDGWTTSMSTRAADSVKAIQQLAFFAALMRLSLIYFSFLLMSWTLLP